MKLLTLNTWGGQVFEPLMQFIKKQSADTDILCFQEVLFGNEAGFTQQDKARVNLFEELSKTLVGFKSFKHISNSGHFQSEEINFPAGQAIFVRESINVINSGGFRCYDKIPEGGVNGGKLSGNCMWIDFEHAGKIVTLANLHGLWQGGTGKKDTPERLLQSKKIVDFFKTKHGPKILAGDYNLLPTGESISILEKGMRNWIKESGAQSTRSNLYDKEGKFADYILTSPDIKVLTFEVLQDTVSDHLPLSIHF